MRVVRTERRGDVYDARRCMTYETRKVGPDPALEIMPNGHAHLELEHRHAATAKPPALDSLADALRRNGAAAYGDGKDVFADPNVQSALPGNAWFGWIDSWFKGEYRWQVFLTDLARSSTVPQPLLEEVAGEYADYITKNQGAIVGSLAALGMLGVGAWAAGAAPIFFTAVGVCALAGELEIARKHGVRWIEAAAAANGGDVTEASKAFIEMITSLAMVGVAADAATTSALSASRSMPPLVRTHIPTSASAGPILDAKPISDGVYAVPGRPFAQPRAESRHVPLTEAEQYQLLVRRPLAGMSQSGDEITSGATESSLRPASGTRGHATSNAIKPAASAYAKAWRLFETPDGKFWVFTTEKDFTLLKNIKTGVKTSKEIQVFVGRGNETRQSAIARNTAARLTIALNGARLGPNEGDGLKDAGAVIHDGQTGYIFLTPAQLENFNAATAKLEVQTTKLRQPVKAKAIGTVWLELTPFQRELLEQLIQRGTWNAAEMETYIETQWRSVRSDVALPKRLVHQTVEAIKMALRHATTGPKKTDGHADVGRIELDNDGYRFVPFAKIANAKPWADIKVKGLRFWFEASEADRALLQRVLDGQHLMRKVYGPDQIKRLNTLLRSAGTSDSKEAPRVFLGEIILKSQVGSLSAERTYQFEPNPRGPLTNTDGTKAPLSFF